MDYLYSTTNNATPMISALAVTPNDGADLVPANNVARPTRGVLVGGAGTLAVVMADGNPISLTIPATACGVILPISVNRIKATGTSATNIVAFY